MFSRLFNRYIFEADLFLKAPLHIGCGRSSELTDSPFIRDFDGRPIIPGSSLRGALRSHMERISRSLGLDSCLLFEDSDSRCLTSCEETKKALKEKLDQPLGIKEKEKKVQEFLSKPGHLCFTCRLFGSTYQASKIKIGDLTLARVDDSGDMVNKNDNKINMNDISQQKSNYKSQIRDGIAINRDTDTTVTGAKFDYEVIDIERGGYFNLEIYAENLDEVELGLIALGIQEMMSGHVRLGGNKAIGIGNVCLKNLRIRYFDENDGFGLKEYLQKEYLQQENLKKKKDIEGDIKKNIKENKEASAFLKEKIKIFLAFAGQKERTPC